jgi:hypothetical protein
LIGIDKYGVLISGIESSGFNSNWLYELTGFF